MAVNTKVYQEITGRLQAKQVTLVAVSKTKPVEDIQALYDLGQRDFGENYVQELGEKQLLLPNDIRWHFIGHLQSNKVKYIAPFVHLIHGVDSFKLLKEINKQGLKCGRVIHCLLQVHIAQEETKFGMDENELKNATLHGFT
jgi:pyridoxal phosphate enzyme (YggS family)